MKKILINILLISTIFSTTVKAQEEQTQEDNPVNIKTNIINVNRNLETNPNLLDGNTQTNKTANDNLNKNNNIKIPTINVDSNKNPTTNNNEIKYSLGQIIIGKPEIIDAQSLKIEDYFIRLDGIETPGKEQYCYDKKGLTWKCGEKSIENLNNVIQNKKVTCIINSILAKGAAGICYIDNMKFELNKYLVEIGYAIPNKFSKNRYNYSLNIAKNNNKGLWSGTFTSPEIWRSKNK